MNKITFDYSKAASFVKENEVESMKKLALDTRNAIAGSVVVPDLEIILMEKSLSPMTSIKCLI